MSQDESKKSFPLKNDVEEFPKGSHKVFFYLSLRLQLANLWTEIYTNKLTFLEILMNMRENLEKMEPYNTKHEKNSRKFLSRFRQKPSCFCMRKTPTSCGTSIEKLMTITWFGYRIRTFSDPNKNDILLVVYNLHSIVFCSLLFLLYESWLSIKLHTCNKKEKLRINNFDTGNTSIFEKLCGKKCASKADFDLKITPLMLSAFMIVPQT